jgi:hypothetical protein
MGCVVILAMPSTSPRSINPSYHVLQRPIKKMTPTANRILAELCMIWIPDPPEMLHQKLKQVCYIVPAEVSAISSGLLQHERDLI